MSSFGVDVGLDTSYTVAGVSLAVDSCEERGVSPPVFLPAVLDGATTTVDYDVVSIAHMRAGREWPKHLFEYNQIEDVPLKRALLNSQTVPTPRPSSATPPIADLGLPPPAPPAPNLIFSFQLTLFRRFECRQACAPFTLLLCLFQVLLKTLPHFPRVRHVDGLDSEKLQLRCSGGGVKLCGHQELEYALSPSLPYMW